MKTSIDRNTHNSINLTVNVNGSGYDFWHYQIKNFLLSRIQIIRNGTCNATFLIQFNLFANSLRALYVYSQRALWSVNCRLFDKHLERRTVHSFRVALHVALLIFCTELVFSIPCYLQKNMLLTGCHKVRILDIISNDQIIGCLFIYKKVAIKMSSDFFDVKYWYVGWHVG